MSKYTAGPWQVNSGMVETVYDHKDCKLSVPCGCKVPIAYMDRKPGNGTMPVERDANAQLISLAPELAQVAIELKAWADYMGGWDAKVWGKLNKLVLRIPR